MSPRATCQVEDYMYLCATGDVMEAFRYRSLITREHACALEGNYTAYSRLIRNVRFFGEFTYLPLRHLIILHNT
jgi:hypothetical protein